MQITANIHTSFALAAVAAKSESRLHGLDQACTRGDVPALAGRCAR